MGLGMYDASHKCRLIHVAHCWELSLYVEHYEREEAQRFSEKENLVSVVTRAYRAEERCET